ncbi:Glycosyltransferase [Vibrio chagasii]|nr:Glycosyltransferase [Vibrio chagasii]
MRIILSNSDVGGGIAFNVDKISKELAILDAGNTRAFYLNRSSLFNFCIENIKHDKLKLYATSAKTLYFSIILAILRRLCFKRTVICQIIYHPRFIDPSVSNFRVVLRSAIKNLGLNNVIYYSTECVKASKLESIESLPQERLIGLASIFGDINEVECLPEEYNDFLNKKFRYKISTVGRFVNFKFGYLRGLIEFAKKNRDVGLMIVGYGPLEDDLRALSDNSSNIFFFGEQDIEATKSIIKKSDLYIGMGTTLVDASSINVPSLIAIESATDAISPGFFGCSSNMSFGEFDKEESYKSINEYILNFEPGLSSEFNIYSNKPWVKIDSQEKKTSNINFLNSIIVLFKLILANIARVFSKKDYH